MNKWFRNLLKGLSFTTVLFVFQACYGTGGGRGISIEFNVVSSDDGHPVEGIKISSTCDDYVVFTDSEGKAYYWLDYSLNGESARFTFEDVDGAEHGLYNTMEEVVQAEYSKSCTIRLIKAE